MKILFLHISDIHIKDRAAINEFQIKKIADSLNSFAYDRILITISGDIAFSGKKDQYKVARALIGCLVDSIKKSCNHRKYMYVLMVPGNHDIDQTNNPLLSKDLQNIRQTNNYESNISDQIQRQENFFAFANRYQCFPDSHLLHQRIVDLDGYKVEFNLINSGVFSSLEQDKGLHYINEESFNTLNAPTGADFVLTMMHHAPDWFVDEQKNRLESVIYSKSSLVYFGHEHYLAQKKMSYDDNKAVFIQAGGCLCNDVEWQNSAYHVGVLNTEDNSYQHTMLVWNASQKQYEQKDPSKQLLPKKPSSEKKLMLTDEFSKMLFSDDKRELSDNFLDYYVFPRLEPEIPSNNTPKEYCTEDSFLSEIKEKKRVLIVGGYNSGKTCLLKKLFLALSESEIVPIYCGINDIRGKHSDRIIKNCFMEEYGDSASDYDRFLQLPKEKRALVIDDVDQVSSDSLTQFIGQLDDVFEYYIFSSKQLIDLSLFERMKAQLKTSDSVYKYKISPLYADKREEVIDRVVRLKIEDKIKIGNTIKSLCEAINAQKNYISLDPDFVIKYVEYFINNIGDANTGDTSVFNKVFEASIINAISVYQTPKMSVDKMFVLLSKIAHFIHFNKAYPISEKQVMSLIDCYNKEYGTFVKGTEFVDIAVKSRIMQFDEIANGYRFVNKNHLAYFVATEVNRNYHDTGDDSDLRLILHNACFGINADILLFISYITDNVRILNLILNMAESYTKEWDEFDFGEHLPDFLKENRIHNVSLPPANAHELEKIAEIEAERKSQNQLTVIDIYDYNDEQADEFVNKIIRSLQLLIIVSRCLPNFEHLMRKTEKDAFVNAIYTLPNKIFNAWAQDVDSVVDEIINFFKGQQNDYFMRQKQVSDQDIIKALQWAAMSLLLDLYNLPVVLAAKDHTAQYLNDFQYKDKETYSLEHLMVLEKSASPQAFISEAKKLENDNHGALYSAMLRRVVGHALVFKNDLSFSDRQQLQSRFFPGKTSGKRFLVERLQNQRKEE